jgi:hypothetical protein
LRIQACWQGDVHQHGVDRLVGFADDPRGQIHNVDAVVGQQLGEPVDDAGPVGPVHGKGPR